MPATPLISFATWRRVVLGAGAGIVFGFVLTGFLMLTGALQLSPGNLPASSVLAEALTRACEQLVPWLLLWLVVVPALLRVPFAQPWLALVISAGLAVVLVPRALDVTEISTSQLCAIGLFSLVTGLPVVRAADIWLVAPFVAALHVVTVSIAGLPFGGSGYGIFDARLTGDVLLTGGPMGPVFGVFGMLGQLWVAGALLRHQSSLFASARGWMRSRGDGLRDFGLGLLVASASVALLFMAMLVTGQSRIAAVLPSLGALSASLSRNLPSVLAEEWLYRYALLSLILLLVRRGWIAVIVSSAAVIGLHLMAPGTTAFTAAGVGAAALAAGIAFVSTGRLWMPVALGFGWQLCMGPIFGFASGGMPVNQSWFRQEILQYTAWSGGVHGPDAGLFGIAAKLLMVAAVMWLAGRRTLDVERGRTRDPGPGTRDHS